MYNNKLNKLIESALTGKDIENYLYQFKRESDYQGRQENSYYINYLEGIIDSITVPLFSQTITRESNNDLYNVFINNVDRRGTTMNDFMYSLLKSYKAHGNAFIIMNNFTEFSATLSEQLDNRELPWINMKTMVDLYDYEDDDFGNIKFIEFYNGMCTDKKGESKPEIIGYNESYVYTYILGDKEDTLEAEANTFGFIPVISLNPEITPFPTVKDLAKTNIAIYNTLSEQRDLERSSAFCLLEIPNDQPQDANVELGPNNIIWVPTNSSRGSAYVNPDASVLKTLREGAESMVALLQQQAEKLGSIAINKASQSGAAYEMEFLGKNYVLNQLSDFAESVEYKITEMFGLMITATVDVDIIYPDEFVNNLSAITGKLDIIKKSQEIGITYTEDELLVIKEELLKSL